MSLNNFNTYNTETSSSINEFLINNKNDLLYHFGIFKTDKEIIKKFRQIKVFIFILIFN